jgi:hypothetical protein
MLTGLPIPLSECIWKERRRQHKNSQPAHSFKRLHLNLHINTPGSENQLLDRIKGRAEKSHCASFIA